MDKFCDTLVYVKHTELLFEPEKKWFDNKPSDEPEQNTPIKDVQHITALREHARKVYDQDIVNYNDFREKTRRSDHNWIKTVLRTGTIGDRMSANCILVQDSAIHNLTSVDVLISSVKLNKKRECILAIDALKDLFQNYLLPQFKLKSFHEHPFEILPKLGNKDNAREKRLLLWYFESLLKTSYATFVKSLQSVYMDTLTTSKFKVTHTLFELIKSNPYEQVRTILETIINKLGDPEYKVASRIIYDVKNYLTACPKAKMEVLLEIERLVSRPNINQRAQYYGFCCMNQFILKRQDSEVANRLLIIYFSFFKKFIKNKEIDTRMLNALLTGVNRAYKYAKMNHEEIDKNLNTLFKLVHVTSFNVSIQALMLLNQVMDSRDDMNHRYYNALYKKMFELEWRNTSKQTYFLNLLFNSVKKDEAVPRVKAFVKRLLQICFSQNVPFNCGSFMLVSEILKSKKNLFQFDSSLLANNNLLVKNRDKIVEEEDDDEEENFKDIVLDTDDEEGPLKESKIEVDDKESAKENKVSLENGKDTVKDASWIHKKNIIFKKHNRYDPTERNPLYSGADKTLTFELLPFTRHYHPTVVVFANKLLNNEPIDYTGDPMMDFTLIHFLDRFVYKNPKKNKHADQKGGKKSIFEAEKSIYSSSIKNLAVNSKEYLKLDPSSIPAEEKFFYDYYKAQLNKKNPNSIDENDEVASEAGSVSDDDFDKYLAKNETDGFQGDDSWALNFADGVTKKSKKQKKQKEKELEEEDDDDDIMDEFENDEEFEQAMNEEGDDGLDEIDMDENDMASDGFDDFNEELAKKTKPKKKFGGKGNLNGLFAAADEFSDLINESSKNDDMGIGSISNKDKSNAKQLKWEMNRFSAGGDHDGFGKRGGGRMKNRKSPGSVQKKNSGKKAGGKNFGGSKKNSFKNKRKR